MPVTRQLGPWSVPPIGLGCMNISHAYGEPASRETAEAVLQKALDIGVTHFDSAALYGFGRNEELVGHFLKPHRDNIVLVSKGGMRGENGVRTIDASPAKLRKDIENSLRRLQTDVIDLYYLHRYDKVTPIEESVGQLARFIEEGKVKEIGLSEASAKTIRKGYVEHPIAVVQSEYSLWSRNSEVAVLDTCAELGISFVAYAPVGRGFLTSKDLDPNSFTEKDIRRIFPRFQEPHFSENCKLLPELRAIAADAGYTAAQLSLAWILQRGDHVHAIPGTTSVEHLEENVAAMDIRLSAEIIERVEALVNPETISGPRYPEATQKEIDTELLPHELQTG